MSEDSAVTRSILRTMGEALGLRSLDVHARQSSCGRRRSARRRRRQFELTGGLIRRFQGIELIMPIALYHESGNTYRLEISGVLSREAFARAEDELKIELSHVGSARLLCVLTGFQGWETGGDWSNMAFYMRHGNAIERIAIVGDERWRDLTMMFASADLRRAPVQFFAGNSLAGARTWLSG
jgi:hypothetical protein